jgi:2'-5' RNA ligase
MPTIRSFVALPSSDDVKSCLGAIQAQLIEEGAAVKWDAVEKFHITLKFLGNVQPDILPRLAASIAPAISEFKSFDLRYTTLGAFPDFDHPRVIWVGAESNESLVLLQRQIDLTCERHGFPRDSRAFHAHITLGRVKGIANLRRLTARAKSTTFEPIKTHCSEVLLIKSELRPAGSVYTTLNSFPLKA